VLLGSWLFVFITEAPDLFSQPSGTEPSLGVFARAQSGSVPDPLLLGRAYANGFGVPKLRCIKSGAGKLDAHYGD